MKNIEEGSVVVIEATGMVVYGKVVYADYCGDSDGWFIDLVQTNTPSGVSSWVQKFDGGRILSVDGIPFEKWVLR